ncbi:hypothetical protein BJV74DRAFT_459531 [Russula compacta]|nr:hypothetical protein BJV74DRAFT_459531 [Russula compacta]
MGMSVALHGWNVGAVQLRALHLRHSSSPLHIWYACCRSRGPQSPHNHRSGEGREYEQVYTHPHPPAFFNAISVIALPHHPNTRPPPHLQMRHSSLERIVPMFKKSRLSYQFTKDCFQNSHRTRQLIFLITDSIRKRCILGSLIFESMNLPGHSACGDALPVVPLTEARSHSAGASTGRESSHLLAESEMPLNVPINATFPISSRPPGGCNSCMCPNETWRELE